MHFEQDGADRNHQNRQVDQELHVLRPVFFPSLNRKRGNGPGRSVQASTQPFSEPTGQPSFPRFSRRFAALPASVWEGFGGKTDNH